MHIRKITIIRNAGWYDKLGKKIDWGDLSAGDFKRISKEIKAGEFFITLDQLHSDRAPKIPDINYVAKHALFVIASKKLYRVYPTEQCRNSKSEFSKLLGLRFKILTPSQVKELMIKSG